MKGLIAIVLLVILVGVASLEKTPTKKLKTAPRSFEPVKLNITLPKFVRRDDLLPCIKHVFDVNQDNEITFEEVSNGLILHLSNHSRLHTLKGIDATWIMTMCDFNKDNVLNATDWENYSCLEPNNRAIINIVNMICEKIMNGTQY